MESQSEVALYYAHLNWPGIRNVNKEDVVVLQPIGAEDEILLGYLSNDELYRLKTHGINLTRPRYRSLHK